MHIHWKGPVISRANHLLSASLDGWLGNWWHLKTGKNIESELQRGWPQFTVTVIQDDLDTVSLGKGFGSKGKQHQKHTALETQSHTQ
jgi:hypothetical protein